MHTPRLKPLVSLGFFFGLLLAPLALPAESSTPDHLYWAERLVAEVAPAHNSYNTPTQVAWAGENGAEISENQSVCSTLLTALLKQSEGLSSDDFEVWLGSTSPYAADYYEAIVSENGFTAIRRLDQVRAGDIIAISYANDPDATTTGHIAIVDRVPLPRSATAPLVPGTRQYAITIIDSSKSGHGKSDTRKTDDGYVSGVGKGVMRLYTDTEGRIVGHTWSLYSNSLYYGEDTRELAIGRLNGGIAAQ